MKKLENQVALITGAGSGIGRAQALLFASNGAKIIAADINLAAAQETTGEIAKAGGEAFAIKADVSSQQDIEAMVRLGVERYDKISLLSNTAGIFDNYSPLLDTSFEDWSKYLDINVNSLFRVTKAVLPLMIEQNYGIIINISSGAGLIGGGGGIGYTSSKHAVIGFTKQLNAEYGNNGIRANVIAPGLIDTPMVRALIENKDAGIMETLKKLPAARHGQPQEIADAALFLASDYSRYIYGAVIPVDGGLLSTLR